MNSTCTHYINTHHAVQSNDVHVIPFTINVGKQIVCKANSVCKQIKQLEHQMRRK